MSHIEVRTQSLNLLAESPATFLEITAPVVGNAVQLNYLGPPDAMAALGVIATKRSLEVWRINELLDIQDLCHPVLSNPIPELIVKRQESGCWVVERALGVNECEILDKRGLSHFIARVVCELIPHIKR